MMLNIDEVAIRESVSQRVADQLIDDSDLVEEVRKNVDKRIEKLFAERVDKLITEAIDEAVRNGFEREYTRVDQWGQKQGETTSVKRQLDKMVSDYWSSRVDSRTGKPSDSSYNTVSRAEYTMMTVTSEKFSNDLKAHALNICGHLKDGLRTQLAKHMDSMLDDLFRVKSLQDQGKVEKPY